MSPEIIGVLTLVVLFIVLFAGMPIGLGMAAVGFTGFAVICGFGAALGMLKMVPFTSVASYTLSVLPLFLLMGQIVSLCGLAEDVYQIANKWLGHLPGGLAMATIGGCAGFAAVCGTSIAEAAAMVRIAWPEMKRYDYDPKLGLGSIAAGGTLGILIPPSVPFIVYGILAEVSIGRLFIAGIFPGIILTALFITTIAVWVKLKPSLVGTPGIRYSWFERLAGLKNIWGVALLVLLVMGGIWLGIFSPIEAGGIGACGAFLIALSRKQLNKQRVITALRDTVKMTGMVMVIMIGAMIFNYFLAVSRLPVALAEFVSNLQLPPMGVLIVILFIYLLLGCIMDCLAMVLLTLPIFLPLLNSLGFDLVWFGVIFTIMSELALITPPIGLNVFIIGGANKEVPMYTVFMGILPFALAMLVGVVFVVAFPQLSLFLPTTMRGPG